MADALNTPQELSVGVTATRRTFGMDMGASEVLEVEEGIPGEVRSVGRDITHRLKLKQAAIESLDERTRRYLHINDLGIPLPAWLEWDKQPRLNRFNYWRSRVHTIMTDASSSPLGMFISNFMVVTIILSVASFCLETVPAFQKDRAPAAATVFTWVEAVTIQIFALDYLTRFFTAPHFLKFIVDPFNIIDVISIVPWYIIVAVKTDFNGTTVFRVARLFRVFRVLKLGGRYSRLLVVLSSLYKSVEMLGLMVFFVSLCIMLFATLMYFAERGSWNAQLGYYTRENEVQMYDYDTPKPSPFESIVSGFWWAMVTLLTVGYGDAFPITAGGKVIACVAMVCGILVLALPISVVGATFSSDWAVHKEVEKRRAAAGAGAVSVTSPPLRNFQRLLSDHVEDVDALADLNKDSEMALEDCSSGLHHTFVTTKKHLHTEAKADLRLRRVARGNRADDTPYDNTYGYLSMEHVKERYREQLLPMAKAAEDLGTRAAHVMRMTGVNAYLLDPEVEAAVARLSKKHADLALLLDKHEEKPSPLTLLQAELKELRQYVQDCAALQDAMVHSKGWRMPLTHSLAS